MGLDDRREREALERRIAASVLPRPVFHVREQFLHWLARTKFGDAIAQRNPAVRSALAELETSLSEHANTGAVVGVTETVGGAFDALFLIARGQYGRAEDLLDAMFLAKNPHLRFDGNEKGVMRLGIDAELPFAAIIEQLGSTPGWYRFPDEETAAVYREASFAIEELGFRILPLLPGEMKRWIVTRSVKYPSAEKYVIDTPAAIPFVRAAALDLEAAVQQKLQHIPRRQYAAAEKIGESLRSSTEPLTASGYEALHALTELAANRSCAIFSDGTLENRFIDAPSAITTPEEARAALVASDFDTFRDRTVPGHVFVDAVFKTNVRAPTDLLAYRQEWYTRCGFSIDACTRFEELGRMIRITHRYGLKFPLGVVAGAEYMSTLFGEEIEPSIPSYVRFMNRHGLSVARSGL
jgi:hypothetical protein